MKTITIQIDNDGDLNYLNSSNYIEIYKHSVHNNSGFRIVFVDSTWILTYLIKN